MGILEKINKEEQTIAEIKHELDKNKLCDERKPAPEWYESKYREYCDKYHKAVEVINILLEKIMKEK